MFSITEPAGKHLAGLLNQSGQEDSVVRFVIEGNRVNMKVGVEKEEDLSFHHEGDTVLVLSETVADKLRNYTLDLNQSGETPQLELKSDPN
jgi:Fe-S cluster assembly iron-binding protein IscA